MNLSPILALSLLIFCPLLGCSSRAVQPTSPYSIIVRHQGSDLADIRVDVFQQQGSQWTHVLSGITVSGGPGSLFPVRSKDQVASIEFDAQLPIRVTLESIGSGILPLDPRYGSPDSTPIHTANGDSAESPWPWIIALPEEAIQTGQN